MEITRTAYLCREILHDGSTSIAVWPHKMTGDCFQDLANMEVTFNLPDSALTEADSEMVETLNVKLDELKVKHHMEEKSVQNAIDNLLSLQAPESSDDAIINVNDTADQTEEEEHTDDHDTP